MGAVPSILSRWYTLQGTNISHLGERKIIFKMPFLGGYVSFLVVYHLSILLGVNHPPPCCWFARHLSLGNWSSFKLNLLIMICAAKSNIVSRLSLLNFRRGTSASQNSEAHIRGDSSLWICLFEQKILRSGRKKADLQAADFGEK